MKKTDTSNDPYQPGTDYLRVASVTPAVSLGNVPANTAELKKLYDAAVNEGASLVVTPELSLTGYTIGDLVLRPGLQNAAVTGLMNLADHTVDRGSALIVGLPLRVDNALYNCAALVADGRVAGIVPKQNLPTYNEFYEKRWFQTWDTRPDTNVRIGHTDVPFGRNLVFTIGHATVGIEVCEDLWVPEQPSTRLAGLGALVIANPSASPEAVTKPAYRRGLVAHTSARNVVGYVYAGAGPTESTADIVMAGHSMIAELGGVLAERAPFSTDSVPIIADIDVARIRTERLKTTNFPNFTGATLIDTGIDDTLRPFGTLRRTVDPFPFVPRGDGPETRERLGTILSIQATGLAMRMRNARIPRVVLGLSGGLDSTLALLVAVRAAAVLKTDPAETILTLTMPGVASSQRTQSNAAKLAKALDVPNHEIPIAQMAADELKAIGHAGDEDVTYENTQARLRTALLFNTANAENGLVLGTGDMSEIALGWSTYNGDHMSHYNPNASIPKTLVRSLVTHAALGLGKEAQAVIGDILDTPVSPELIGNGSDIIQSTEDLIGPYALHDFFLYHFVRLGEPRAKIAYLAGLAFAGTYDAPTVEKWLTVFLGRFYKNQYKRQASPDGAKVGIGLSPKADWRMPAEASFADI